MRPLERKLLTGCLLVAVSLLIFGIVWPAFAPYVHRGSPATACLSNLKQLGLGLLMYSNDENDRFPPRDLWADAIVPYTKNPDLFYDPALRKEEEKGPYAYAFNGALSLAKTPPKPETVPMVYDSVVPLRNASDLFKSLPYPGRHKGRDNVAYADGHAKSIAVVP